MLSWANPCLLGIILRCLFFVNVNKLVCSIGLLLIISRSNYTRLANLNLIKLCLVKLLNFIYSHQSFICFWFCLQALVALTRISFIHSNLSLVDFNFFLLEFRLYFLMLTNIVCVRNMLILVSFALVASARHQDTD